MQDKESIVIIIFVLVDSTRCEKPVALRTSNEPSILVRHRNCQNSCTDISELSGLRWIVGLSIDGQDQIRLRVSSKAKRQQQLSLTFVELRNSGSVVGLHSDQSHLECAIQF